MIMDVIALENEQAAVTFDPKALQGMQVCEYAEALGDSGRQALDAFLQKYSMCLDTYKRDEKGAILVKPNLRPSSSQLTNPHEGSFLCKCE